MATRRWTEEECNVLESGMRCGSSAYSGSLSIVLAPSIILRSLPPSRHSARMTSCRRQDSRYFYASRGASPSILRIIAPNGKLPCAASPYSTAWTSATPSRGLRSGSFARQLITSLQNQAGVPV